MTEPNRHRYCDSCGFEGDVSRFIKKGPDGVAIRSKFKAAHLDQLRYGVEEARENGYYPYEEFCPVCGYNTLTNDDATNALCLKKGRGIRIRREEARKQKRNNDMFQMGLFIFFTALATWLIIKYA